MAKYRIRRISDDAILYNYEDSQPSPGKFGGDWGNLELVVHEAMPQEDIDSVAREEMWDRVRAIRDNLLSSQVDNARNYMLWADAAGSAWSAGKKEDWAEYRQALCDMPQTIQDMIDDPENPLEDIKDLDLEALEWPEAPEL